MKIITNIPEKSNVPTLKYNNNINNNFNKEFRVVFVGDTTFGDNYIPDYKSKQIVGFNIIKHYGYDYFFEKIKQGLFDAQLVIANLETPLLDIKNTPRPIFPFSTRYNSKYGRYQHWSNPQITPTYLKKYNITLVSLENNHMLDYGIEGLSQTLESLNNNRIRFFGAGFNRKEARKPFIKRILVGNQNMKLVVFSAFEYRKGYDKDFDFYASSSKGGVNRLSFTAITNKIKKLRDDEENIFIVIFPHWSGTRSYGWKTDSQTEMGHKLIDAGADLVIGHGPHNLQQIEKYKGRWILYSLGNFVYNAINKYTRYNAPPYSMIVKLILSDQKIDNILKREDIPNVCVKKNLRIYAIVTDNIHTKFQPRFVNEMEFEFVYKCLFNGKYSEKPSEDEVKVGRDQLGRFLELSLD